MSKTKTFKTRMLYVLAVVAVLAMLIPLAAAPVSAQPPAPTITPASAHDIIGDSETFTVAGLPAGVTVVNWQVTNTPNGAANAFVTANTATSVTVQAFGWGEAAVTAILSNNTTLTAFKKWGKIDATLLTPQAQNVPVVWNETTKIFSANATLTETVTGTFLLENPNTHLLDQFHETATGAILNFFLLKDNPSTQAWLQSRLSGGNPAGWWTSAAVLADLNNPANAAWRATFAFFGTPGTTSLVTSNGNVVVSTTGEEAVLVVVIAAYPGAAATELAVPVEWAKINFWTREMEKVPQVRWAGEKIVLEKFFGTGTRPNETPGAPVGATLPWPGTLVRFSLENQSPGSLEGIGAGANLGNFTNTTQTVWSIVGIDGYARVMLVSEAPGEVDVDLAVYNENIFVGGDGDNLLSGTIINQHGFVVFYLKLEEITLGNVVGKRAAHNAGLFEPPNPWNAATDVTTETLNVSQDTLLRARVKGWFMGDNLSTRAARVQDYDLFTDSDGNGIPNDDADVMLPAGRWVLPDDWPKLAGPDWAEQRIHWDIMDNPFDTVRSLAPTVGVPPTDPRGVGYYGKIDVNPAVAGYHGSGPYYLPNPPQGKLVAAYPVIGPFRPGIEEPTFDGYNPNVLPFAVPQQKSVVPNGVLDWWDAPMPPSKITFEIMSGAGFFKDAYKSDIYYIWDSPAKVSRYYTNPFYFEMIPASWYIPAFVNNGGYDWDSWAGVTVAMNGTVTLPPLATPVAWAPYGPYEFWKIINRPLPAAVPSADMANFPTKVQVYSDNHGEAMVWLNGNWNLNLGAFLTNGAVDIPEGTIVGTSNVVAMADYPYFRKHPKLVSSNVTKTWTWGGVILGTDQVTFPGGTIQFPSPMVLSTGTWDPSTLAGIPPNEVAKSPKKLVWLWITDRDVSPVGVRDTVIQWSVTGGGTVTIADFGFVHGVSNYNNITENIDLQNGFLAGTNGMVTPGTAKTQGVSGVRAPTDIEKQLFAKFYPTLDPNDFVVAAVEILTANATIDVTVQALITSREFAAVGNPLGTLIRNINVNFAASYPLDDEPVYGDANADGVVNMGDVIAVERTILGLKTPYIGADANIDRKINMGDVIKIEKIILGLD